MDVEGQYKGQYKCAHCGEESSYQGHMIKDERGYFFSCDSKNEGRLEAVVDRISRAIDQRNSKQFSGYNNGGEDGQRGSYIYKSGVGSRKQ